MAEKHRWVGAAEVSIASSQVEHVAANSRLRVRADVMVSVLDVYCTRCRRSFTPELAEQEECTLGPQHVGGPRIRVADVALVGSRDADDT